MEGMNPLTERYAKQISGVLSCFDRIVVSGTLPGVCYAEGMASHLRARGIKLFDYPKIMAVLREYIRERAEAIARGLGLTIEYIRSSDDFRKEERIQKIVAQRGEHVGMVHIFSAMEPCTSFYPWHDKPTGQTSLKRREGRCLHYYFYFIHEEFGLCYLRVPTWAPFRLQFYCNGHNWLARELEQEGIAFTQVDNTFVEVANWERAQTLSDRFPVDRLHHALDELAGMFCPVHKSFDVTYHWSLMQVEYATDLAFGRREDLSPVYDSLIRTATHAVKPEHVTMFLGRKLDPRYQAQLGTDFQTRIQGTKIKHHMGPVAVKMYDKLGRVLRIETLTNQVSFFKHHRKVEHRDGRQETKLAPMRKTIHSLDALRHLLGAANRRYLDYLSQLLDPSAGVRQMNKLCQPVQHHQRSYRGFNPFDREDCALLLALADGGHNLNGFYNRTLRRRLRGLTGAQVSRLLKRLRLHGLIKKIGHTYKYYLTKFGQQVVLTALKLRELVVIPALAGLQPA